jgi:paraquat-inducible protein B
VSKNETSRCPGRTTPAASEPTTAKLKPHARFSPVWLIPIVAAALVVYVGYSAIANRGRSVTLTLLTADGLTVDQTQVKHKAVTVGTVESIKLSKDMKSAVVGIRMAADTDAMLTDHARFWVVRPRLSAGSLTGIETLVSGAYVEVDPGDPGGKEQRDFTALAQPPGRQSDEPGKVFVLQAKRLGSLNIGSPIYYRDVEVGEVLSFDLGEVLGSVKLRVFVRAPFDRFVHTQTRFWNASGLSVTTGADGMRLELQSLQSLLSGGITFETPPSSGKDDAANESVTFNLYEDKAAADNALYSENIPYVTYFRTSVQGLSANSPVQISGVQVGSVSDVKLVYDPDARGMIARVAFNLQPERVVAKGDGGSPSSDVRKALSDSAMRVQLESSNLLTGAKDLAIEYLKDKAAADLPKEGEALVLPSAGGGLDGLTASLADIATKIDRVPFEQIGNNANAALTSVQHLAADVDTNATPALAQLPAIAEQMSDAAKNANGALGPSGYGQNSEFARNMERLMREVNDTARSFRVLTDYLDRHPESLLRGRAVQASER